MQALKFPRSKNLILAGVAVVLVIIGIIYFATLPVAEVAIVQRGTAISAIYGTVRIEPSLVLPVRAQNSGFIQLAEVLSAGRGAIGRSVEKGELLATIADEATARQLKQARADLQAAKQRGELPLPSAEALKVAEDNLGRLEKLSALSNVAQVEFEKAKSEVKRLKALVETERIERDRNLDALDETTKKLEAQMKNSEIRSPVDGLLTAIKTIDGELVAERAELFTVSSRKNYVRGEVDEEDVGEVKAGMEAIVQVYAFRTR
ncbi:MAG: HlyD family secretion protein, partial [Verrucomicrobiota bacterium]